MKLTILASALDFAEQTMPDAQLFDGGEGGAVFRATIGGQPAVIKVTDRNPKKEFAAVQALTEKLDSAPPDVRAHLPRILRNKLVDFGGTTYGVIAMEPLEPATGIEAAFATILESERYPDSRRVHDISADAVREAAVAATARLDAPDNIRQLTADLMIAYAAENISVRTLYADDSAGEKLVEFLQRRLRPNAPERTDLRSAVSIFMMRLEETAELPTSHEAPMLPSADPRIAGVQKTLQWLEAEGLLWHDMHPGNIMQRPDGQLVLIDFGQYDLMQYAPA